MFLFIIYSLIGLARSLFARGACWRDCGWCFEHQGVNVFRNLFVRRNYCDLLRESSATVSPRLLAQQLLVATLTRYGIPAVAVSRTFWWPFKNRCIYCSYTRSTFRRKNLFVQVKKEEKKKHAYGWTLHLNTIRTHTRTSTRYCTRYKAPHKPDHILHPGRKRRFTPTGPIQQLPSIISYSV